ncbi:MAG: hypothetical protein IJ526_11360 [Lachnospiraceae bacterium]|jgi:hypothetical protein|nr:hypothetical protein [Lachnospiraceae bacterium]
MISPLFTTIVIVAGFIFVFMKITSEKPGDGIRSFRERERRADSTLKQPLDNLPFIQVPLDSIPSPEPAINEKCAALLAELNALAGKKIVNLTGISNTDLKLTYGAPNLPILTEYDQNFTSLCMNLHELGCEYKLTGHEDEAITTFNVAVNVGTDISGTYTTLAEMYAEKGLYVEIQRLINCADNIRSLTRTSTIKKLQNILDSHTSAVIKLSGDEISSQPDPDSILPADILDILETVPYKSSDQT